MSKTLYKNWKTEIAWLRTESRRCGVLAAAYLDAGYDHVSGDFEKLERALSNRANRLEKAKNAVPQ